MHEIIDFCERVCGVKLYPGQRAVLSDYYESSKQNWLLLSGRRGGKSLLSDLICAYEAVVPDFSAYVRPGEERYILLVSVREDSAKMHIRQIAKLLRHTREIGKMISAVKEDRIELVNGCIILSLPASARAARGYTASALVMDEAAFFVDSLGNSSAEAIFTALQPTLATFSIAGRLVITTSVNSKAGLVYDLFSRAQGGELEDWHITKVTTVELNPRVDTKIIQRALKRDPESAQAEYLSEFREQTEAFLSSEALDKCIDRGLERSKTEPGRGYLMAIDPALLKDNYAFGVAHKQDGVIVLDYIHRLTPPVDANSAEDLVASLVERYKPSAVLCDNASTVMRLKPRLPMVYTPFSRPQKIKIYSALKEAVNLGFLNIPYHEDLLEELRALQIRGGVDIGAPKAGRVTHDDMADVLALLVDGLQSGEYAPSTMAVVADPFAEWPPPDGGEYHPAHGWVAGWNRKPHPPGITWENCPHRAKGCFACDQELELAGIFKADEEYTRQRRIEQESIDTDPKSLEEKRRFMGKPMREVDPDAERAARVRKLFWSHIKNTRRKNDTSI